MDHGKAISYQPAVDYLTKIGKWVNANGECIYGTFGSPFPADLDWGYATCKPGRVYLIVKDWRSEISVPSVAQWTPLSAHLLNDVATSIPLKIDTGSWCLALCQPKPVEPFSVIIVEVQDINIQEKTYGSAIH